MIFNDKEMIFDKFFEVGLIIVGLLWTIDQFFDSLIHLHDITLAFELRQRELDKEEKENELSESAKRMYS